MDAQTLTRVKSISMLSENVLAKLEECARQARAGILEIGPYIGGSTVALALGNNGRNAHVAMDIGGAYVEHPTLPSADIARDWRANVERFEVAGDVSLVIGSFNDPEPRAAALTALGKIGLLFVDADGRASQTLRVFADHLIDDAIIVIDDYCAPDAMPKQDMVRACVDWQVRDGGLLDDEIVEGTWFGRLAPGDGRERLTRRPVIAEPPCSFIFFTPSHGIVLEDGAPLGPANATHDTVRRRGGGAHYFGEAGDQDFREARPALRFSTSDNTDPRTNQRIYEIARADGTRERIVWPMVTGWD